MGRSTVYNNITNLDKLNKCNKNNIELGKDFIDYLKSIDRAESTCQQYIADLNIFWVWNFENNNDKDFIKISKREFAKFQNYAMNEWGWSSNRVRRVKSTLSSLSNFIENILDEEEEFAGYRAVVRKIENPAKDVVRDKSVFEPEELQVLLDYLVENKKYLKACTLSLAINSGRRKSEIPRFKLSYFNEENIVFGSLYKTPEKVTTKGRGAKGKLLTLYVLKNGFDPYLKLWLEEREHLGIDSEWLLCNEKGDQLSTHAMNGWVDEFSKILNKPFYWHSMRHNFCTQCLKSNLPSSVVQEIVGWDSADMVNLYDDRDTDDMLSQYFDEGGIKNIESKSLSEM